MAALNSTRPPHSLWRFFKSIKLTFVLLVVLAAASVLGTLIPQEEGAMETLRNMNPGLTQFLSALQLFDMYHSHWFRMIIVLLVANLLVCSTDRFPAAWKLYRSPPQPDRNKVFEGMSPERSFSLKGSKEALVGPIRNILRRHYKHSEERETDRHVYLYGEKGRCGYFGVYIVHFSVLLILIGGMVGSLFGFEAFVNIPEGAATSTVMIRKTHTTQPLPFTVACDKFTVEYYENGSPKEYRSDLKFFRGDTLALEGPLTVNHPITFQGITFYQSTFGRIPGKIRLKIVKSGSAVETYPFEVEQGQKHLLPGKEGTFRIVDVHNDLKEAIGSAVLVTVQGKNGEEQGFWVFQHPEALKEKFPENMLRSPRMNPGAFEPYTFFLEGVDNKFYTGLQVSRDPGVPFVWAGFVMMMVGLLVTFFLHHKRVWIRLEEDGSQLHISVAGKSQKNSIGLERELDHLLVRIRETLESDPTPKN